MGEQNFEVRIIDTAFNYFNMKLFTVYVIALLSMAAAVPAPESPSYSRMRRFGQPSADSASSGSPSSGSPSSGASSPSTPKQKKKPKNKPNKKPNNKPKKQNKKPKTPKTPSPVSPKTPAPVLMNSPVDQAMSLSDMEKFNKNINTKAIIGHGRHCSKYSRTDNVGGSPIDELDAACLDWNRKIKCLSLPGGACNKKGIDFEMFPVQLQADGQLSPDPAFGCAFTENKCQHALCLIKYEFGLMLMDSVKQNGPGSDKWKGYNFNSQCMPNAPVYGEKMCMGKAPDVAIVSV